MEARSELQLAQDVLGRKGLGASGGRAKELAKAMAYFAELAARTAANARQPVNVVVILTSRDRKRAVDVQTRPWRSRLA